MSHVQVKPTPALPESLCWDSCLCGVSYTAFLMASFFLIFFLIIFHNQHTGALLPQLCTWFTYLCPVDARAVWLLWCGVRCIA